MHRRQFLQHSALGVAAAIVACVLNGCEMKRTDSSTEFEMQRAEKAKLQSRKAALHVERDFNPDPSTHGNAQSDY
jgi:hypothetical protein